MSDSFYRAFEEKYRGPREMIKARLRVYLPFVELLKARNASCKAIDLGCGRGEWLELLKEIGINAHGVDMDEGMLAASRELGLSVEVGEAVSFLKSLPDKSQAIVSGFHIVEHIPFVDLQTLVKEALRVLVPAGLLILETPNPENIMVGTTSFYLDPTHIRPIPPSLLAFLPEYFGFYRTKVLRLQEPRELITSKTPNLLDVLGGVSPDYSIVAQKKAQQKYLTAFDHLFGNEFGLTLDTLARRYDAQMEQKAQQPAVELSGVRTDLDGVRADLDKARMERDEMRAEMEKARTDSNGVRTDLDKLRLERDRLQAALDEARTDSTGVRADFGKVRDERDKLRVELDEAQGDKNGFRIELDKVRAEWNRLQAEMEEVRTDSTGVRTDLDKVLDERDKLRVELNEAQDDRSGFRIELDKVRMEQDRLQAELDGARVDSTGVRADLEKVRLERDRLQAGLDGARADSTGVRADLDKVRLERDRQQAELSEVRVDRNGFRTDLKKVRIERDRIQNELDGMRIDLNGFRADIDKVRAERDRLQEEKNELLTGQDRIQTELDPARADLGKAQIARDGLQTELFQVSADIANVRAEGGRLQAELNEVRVDRDRIRTQLDEVWANREQVLAELDKVYHSRSFRITAPLRLIVNTGRILKYRLQNSKRQAAAIPAPVANQVDTIPMEPDKSIQVNAQEMNLDEIMERIRAEVALRNIKVQKPGDLAAKSEINELTFQSFSGINSERLGVKETRLFRFIKKIQVSLQRFPFYKSVNSIALKFKPYIPKYQKR